MIHGKRRTSVNAHELQFELLDYERYGFTRGSFDCAALNFDILGSRVGASQISKIVRDGTTRDSSDRRRSVNGKKSESH